MTLVLVAGCGSNGSSTSSRGSASSPTGPGSSKASGSVRVFAAASLTEAFTEARATSVRDDPGLSITFSFAGSGALVTQITQGAPADVIATADPVSMKRLTDADLVEPPVIFARNTLQVLVAPGNPAGITSLADLARPGLKVVLGDESVPFGRYGAEALARAAVRVEAVSRELDVKAAVAKVTTGEADAGIVYATDVIAAGAKAQGVAIPEAHNVVADYPIAVVKATSNRPAAAAAVDAMVAGAGRAALARRGFLPPP